MTEKIIIIGGGYTGVISALLLAKIKKENGERLYDVTILEKKASLLDGASKLIDRLHIGAEYSLDRKTALDCLKGAFLFKQMLPDVYTDFLYSTYLVAEESQKSKALTLKRVVSQYRIIQQLYSKCFDLFSNKTSPEEAAKLLFGYPEELFSIIPSPPSHVNGFVGGIKTKEKGVNPVLLGAFLQRSLEKEDVKIFTHHQVENVVETPEGFSITTDCNNQKFNFLGDQVVNASWQGRYFLDSMIVTPQDEQDKTHVHLRASLIVDITECTLKPLPIFGMLGKYGGAYSPMNDDIAILYLPDEIGSYLGDFQQNKQHSHVPATWENLMELGPSDKETRAKNMLKNLIQKYPFLEKAKPIDFVTRPILSNDVVLEKRRHAHVACFGDKKNWISAASMKASYAPLTAMEVVEQVQKNSLKNKRIVKKDLILKNKKDFYMLPPLFDLSKNGVFNDPEFPSYAKKYAQEHGLPVQFVTTKPVSSPLSFKRSDYTEPLYFVLIHGGNDLEEGLGVSGTHVHTIKKSVVDRKWAVPNGTDQIPLNTIIQYGTFKNLERGNFNAEIKEGFRLKNVGGDVGISSRACTANNKIVLEDEGIIVGGRAFFGDYEGHGGLYKPNDTYSFLQVFSLKGARSLKLPSVKDIKTLVSLVQKEIPGNSSFAVYFTARMLKETSVSKLIKGSNIKDSHVTLEKIWDQEKTVTGLQQPDVSHLVSLTNDQHKNLDGLLFMNDIQIVPIKQFLVADENGELEINHKTYRKISCK